MPAAATAAALLVYLSRAMHPSAATLSLCSLLGLACTRLTVSLVS